MIIKCLCCQREYDDKQYNKCYYCGFPAMIMAGNEAFGNQDEAMTRYIENSVNEYKQSAEYANSQAYRDENVRVTAVSMVSYEWKINESGQIVLDKKNYIPFENIERFGVQTWIKQKFSRLQRKTVDIEIKVEKSDGSSSTMKVTIQVPMGADFWYVGACFYENSTMKLLLSTNNQISESDYIQL